MMIKMLPLTVDGIEYHPTGSLFRTGLFTVKRDTPAYPPDKIDEDGYLRGELTDRYSREAMARWPHPFRDHDLDDLDDQSVELTLGPSACTVEPTGFHRP